MKNKIIIIALFLLVLCGCSKFLDEKNQTDLNTDFIYKTPEGIGFAVTALYTIERNVSDFGNGEGSLLTSSLLGGDDITFTRAGESSGEWSGPSWYDPTKLNSANKDTEGYWNYNYKIIGKTNEIIFYALQLDQNNPLVIQALSECYCFRAHAYFNLLRRFDNIYLTTTAITPYNVDEPIDYQPANQQNVMNQIKQDLDYAIDHLSWTTTQTGRFTKGFACHVKALADMWPINQDQGTVDLNDASQQIDNIINNGPYNLVAEPKNVFMDAQNLNHSESIFTEQWSNEIGGAATNTAGTITGHRFASATLTRYDKSTVLNGVSAQSLIIELEQGGVSWGRVYPNDYLLSLYDKTNDKRFTQYYRHSFTFNNIPATTPLIRKLVIQSWDIKYLFVNGQPNTNLGLQPTIISQLQNWGPTNAVGKTLNFTFVNGDIVPKFMATNFAYSLHPSSTKYFDKWTRDITFNPSYKDIIVYRFAETYLLGAEVNLRLGNTAKALEYFNKTWTRAGNLPKTSTITLQDILDEDAREFGQEAFGHRWYVLKRFGLNTMRTQIQSYSGCQYNDNINGYQFNTDMDFYSYLNRINYNNVTGKTDISTNISTAIKYDDARNNFTDINVRWPIPQSQINAMGGNFPQNDGYN
jgi:hypothetical protein